MKLTLLLQLAAVAQLAIALLNLALPRILRWTDDLARMPLLLREVFYIHAWFISVTLAIFGVVTFRFAAEIASGTNAVGQWFAAGIGLFWGIRAVMQVTYYSSSHWRGRLDRTVIHVVLLVLYGGMAGLYGWSALAGELTTLSW